MPISRLSTVLILSTLVVGVTNGPVLAEELAVHKHEATVTPRCAPRDAEWRREGKIDGSTVHYWGVDCGQERALTGFAVQKQGMLTYFRKVEPAGVLFGTDLGEFDRFGTCVEFGEKSALAPCQAMCCAVEVTVGKPTE